MKRNNALCSGSSKDAETKKSRRFSGGNGVFKFFWQLPLLVQFKIVREHLSWLHKILTLSQMREFKHLLDSAHAWSSPLQAKLNRSVQALEPGLYLQKKMSLEAVVVFADYDSLSFVHMNLNSKLRTTSNRIETFNAGLSNVADFLDCFLQNYFWVDPTAEIYKFGHWECIVVDRVAGFVRWRDGTVPLTSVVVLPNTCVLEVSSSEVRINQTSFSLEETCNICHSLVLLPGRKMENKLADIRDFRMWIRSTSAESARIVVEYNRWYRSTHDKLRDWGQFFPDMPTCCGSRKKY